MVISKDGKKFKTKSDRDAYELMTGQREITNEDIDKATEYMMNHIPCKDFEKSCGTHIGCSMCPYYHFRLTVLAAFKQLKK